jgi:hypothetical protein
VKRTQQLDGGRLATLLSVMLQLDHAEAESANDEDGTENLRQAGERVEIGRGRRSEAALPR